MGDEDLRRLQRDAARGDVAAAARLARQQVRHGRPPAWTLATTWPLEEAERASDALFTPDGADLLLVTGKAVRALDPSTGRARGEVRPGLRRGVRCAALWEGRHAERAPGAAVQASGGALGRRLQLDVRPRAAVRAHSRPRLVLGEGRLGGPGAGGCSVVASSLRARAAPHVLHEFSDEVDALAAGGQLAVAACGHDARAWTGAGGAIVWRSPFVVRALAVAAQGRRVLAVGERAALVRDLTGPDELSRPAGGLVLVATAALSHDGALAVTATRDEVQVWDAVEGTLVRALSCPEAPVRRVSLSPGGVLAAALADRVRLWHVDTGLSLGVTPGLGLPVIAATLDPTTERRLVVVSPTRVWTLARTG